MKGTNILLAVMAVSGLTAAPVRGQSQPQAAAQSQEQSTSPLYRVTVVARTTKAINYRHISGATLIDFRGTVLLPLGRGHAKVESKRGAVRVQAQFDKLEPANRLGPEFLTYVLWAISPEGRASNLGEVLLDGAKSKVDASTELHAFALVVTAEPYFAVIQPSNLVVLENVVRPDTVGNVEEIEARFELLQRGQFASVSADYQAARLDPRTPLGLYEARNALRIAKGAGADRYALASFQKADQLLRQAETYQKQKSTRKQVETTAREAVQTAEDARAIAAKRQEDERIAQERQAAAERETRAKAETERAKLEAQLASERAAREKAEAEVARAAALAQQQAAQAEAEKARQSVERASREKAEAETARAAALAQQQAAQADAEKARQAAEQAERLQKQAERLRQQAEAEKAELRARLLNQLNTILQTRDTARGLIVSMSDVLFDTASFTLRPAAREKLAKISGIVLGHPGLTLQVEGHTDSVGGDEYNQQLSERRATSVRDFLVQQGVPSTAITARGFGKMQPVASNETAAGRQQNRRVELVVAGEAIGDSVVGSRNMRQ